MGGPSSTAHGLAPKPNLAFATYAGPTFVFDRIVGLLHIYTPRDLVERCFPKLRRSRRLATRYDKIADS